MYDNLMVKDVFEAFIIDDVSGKSYFYGATEETNVSQSVNQEKLTAGIGNKVRAILQSQKEVNFSIQNLFHNDSSMVMQSGSNMTVGTKDIMKHEIKVATGNEGSVECAITGTPKDGKVTVVDKFNKPFVATYVDNKVTITDGVVGNVYTIMYLETISNVSVLPFEAEKFPTVKHVQLHGIAYDPETNLIVADIYYDFRKAMPDGNIDKNYGKGSNTNDKIAFSTLEDEYGNYGEYYVVPVE